MHKHVIKDPVHGTMQFTETEDHWIKPFIDSPLFQRLRHIKQLGMGDFIFPGAVHTRFNHCLGCAYVASQISRQIDLPEEERQLVIIACLLHDVGHGPFSHAFEDLFQQKSIRHEEWTPYFLRDFKTTEFFSNYNQRNKNFPLDEKKFCMIEDMIMHRPLKKHLLADIVSSQLDADRLDYLLRDSHFCGVNYGKYDLSWMLNSMTIVPSDQGDRLGITHKGIGVVEHYLMARRLMTKNIYHHQKKLALEFFLVKLLMNLAENLPDVSRDIQQSRLGKFLLNVNEFNRSHTNKENFLEDNYILYKELSDYDIYSVIKSLAELTLDNSCVAIAKRLHARLMPKIIRLDHIDMMQAETWITDFKQSYPHIKEWQFALIKTPHQSYKINQDPILVTNERNITKPINEISLMVNAVSDRYEQTAFLAVDQAILQDKSVEKMILQLPSH